NFSFNPAALAGLTLTIQRENPHHSLAIVQLTQASSGKPVLIKNLIERVSVPVSAGGDGNLTNRDKLHVGDDISWSTLGGTQSHTFVVKHPAAAQGITVQVVVTAHGGLQRTVTQVLNANGDATSDNSSPNWIAGSGAATTFQAGLSVHSNEKMLKVRW